jgi:hypothetical protein
VCPDHLIPPLLDYYIDIGGGNGRKAMAISSFLHFDLRFVHLWEVIDTPYQSHPFVQTYYHDLSKKCFFDEARSFELPDRSVRFATAFQCLHHLRNQEDLFLLLSSMSKKFVLDGIFILNEHDCDSTEAREIIKNLHTMKNHERLRMSVPTEELLLSRREWREILSFFGFSLAQKEETISRMESNTLNTLIIPASHPHFSFEDVFIFHGRPYFPNPKLFLSTTKKERSLIRKPMWIDHRRSSWKPTLSVLRAPLTGLETKICGVCIPAGKWDNLVKNWLREEDVDIFWIDPSRTQVTYCDIIICELGTIPHFNVTGYVGRFLDPIPCIQRVGSRFLHLSICDLLVKSTPASRIIVPPFRLLTVSPDIAEGLQFPIAIKEFKNVYLCHSLLELK